jgi:hypothetical protein
LSAKTGAKSKQLKVNVLKTICDAWQKNSSENNGYMWENKNVSIQL